MKLSSDPIPSLSESDPFSSPFSLWRLRNKFLSLSLTERKNCRFLLFEFHFRHPFFELGNTKLLKTAWISLFKFYLDPLLVELRLVFLILWAVDEVNVDSDMSRGRWLQRALVFLDEPADIQWQPRPGRSVKHVRHDPDSVAGAGNQRVSLKISKIRTLFRALPVVVLWFLGPLRRQVLQSTGCFRVLPGPLEPQPGNFAREAVDEKSLSKGIVLVFIRQVFRVCC